MDRAEKIGLGTAVGGHVLLLAAFALGLLMSAERLNPPKGITVSLIGEEADVSTAPDAVQEEAAPAAAGESESFEPPPPQQIEKPLPKVQPTIAPPTKPSVQKVVTKPAVKPVTKPKPNSSTAGAGGKSSFERAAEQYGKSPDSTGKAPGTTASKTAAQYKSAASTTIGAEVRPFIPGCAPRTSDDSSLNVFVALTIGKSANLISAEIYDVRGITPSNEAQVAQMKQCVLSSLRAASPYNLDLDGYDAWKNHKVQLKVNFK